MKTNWLFQAMLLLPVLASGSPLAQNQIDLPLLFEANGGQTDPQVKYLSRTNTGTVFLTKQGAVFASKSSVIRTQLVNGSKDASISGEQPIPTNINYYRGKQSISTQAYSRVRYGGVYPGIDLIYYGNQQQLEYDFRIAPGANPKAVHMSFAGADRVSIDSAGDLLLTTQAGQLRQHAPAIYQEINGSRRKVKGSYLLADNHTVSFHIGTYDRSRELIIDPVLTYSTYFGGSNTDQVNDLATDSNGYLYVVGWTTSPDFPLNNSAQPLTGSANIFVSKLTPDGSTLVYSTLLGQGLGTGDSGTSVAVDAEGNAYITGWLCSLYYSDSQRGAFVGKLNADGTLAFLNKFGGRSTRFDEELNKIALGPNGNIYVAGTASNTLPVVNGFAQSWDTGFGSPANAGFLTVFDPSGQNILYSTYIGVWETSAYGMGVDTQGFAYVTGGTSGVQTTPGAFQPQYAGGVEDAYVVKIDPTQTGAASLVWGTHLGGNNWDQGNALTVDPYGIVWITGETESNWQVNHAGFPVTPNAIMKDLVIRTVVDTHCDGTGDVVFCDDAFVTALDPNSGQPLYSTYFGGSYKDMGEAIAVDANQHVYITGKTCGYYFPLTTSFHPNSSSCQMGFFTVLDPSQTDPASQVLYSTLIGGSTRDVANAIALDTQGNAYIAGWTWSTDFYLYKAIVNQGGGQTQNGWIAKFGADVSQNAATSSLLSGALKGHTATAH